MFIIKKTNKQKERNVNLLLYIDPTSFKSLPDICIVIYRRFPDCLTICNDN